MEKKKAEWQRELEKPGWRISKSFDKTYAIVHGHTPWREEWLMGIWGLFVIAVVIAVPVGVIYLLIRAIS